MVDAGNTLHIALNCTQAESLPAVTFRYLAVCSLVNICRLIRPCFVRAGCVVIAPPVVAGGKFRILERHQWKGMDFAQQAESIRELTQKYTVEYIGIDATGLGQGVFQLVRSFYPAAREIRYTPEMKTAMVLKGENLVFTFSDFLGKFIT